MVDCDFCSNGRTNEYCIDCYSSDLPSNICYVCQAEHKGDKLN